MVTRKAMRICSSEFQVCFGRCDEMIMTVGSGYGQPQMRVVM